MFEIMEKRKPTYDLRAFKEAFSSVSRLHLTTTALQGARSLGCSGEDIVAVIQSPGRDQFYKSMTSLADNTVWQDVYHVPWGSVVVYLKFTADVVAGFCVLSFKEK